MYQQAAGDFSSDYHSYFLPNNHHLSSLNLQIDPGTHFSPIPATPLGPPTNKYQRTKSFDSLNFGGHLSFEPAPPPPYDRDISLHSADSAYGTRPQDLYKPRPPLNNFNANSCVPGGISSANRGAPGGISAANRGAPMGISAANRAAPMGIPSTNWAAPGGITSQNKAAQNYSKRLAPIYCSFNANCPPPLPPPRISPLLDPSFPTNATLLAPRLLQLQQQQQQQKESPDSFGYMEPSTASSKKKFFNKASKISKNKLRMACIIAVMVGLLGLLVAMGIAVWSQG